VRLWDTAKPKERDIAVFRKHGSPVVSAAFLANGTQTLSGDRDVTVLPWKIDKFITTQVEPPKAPDPPKPPDMIPLAKP
jgi:hypothetical protein